MRLGPRGGSLLGAVLPAALALGEPFKKAVLGSVSTLGSASTGTRIAELRGIAAEYARRAWFGFGSRSSGGMGMRFGDKVIGSLKYGPAVVADGAVIAFDVVVAVLEVRAEMAPAKSTALEVDNGDAQVD